MFQQIFCSRRLQEGQGPVLTNHHCARCYFSRKPSRSFQWKGNCIGSGAAWSWNNPKAPLSTGLNPAEEICRAVPFNPQSSQGVVWTTGEYSLQSRRKEFTPKHTAEISLLCIWFHQTVVKHHELKEISSMKSSHMDSVLHLFPVLICFPSPVIAGGDTSQNAEGDLSCSGLTELDLGADEVFIVSSAPSPSRVPATAHTVKPGFMPVQ